MWTSPVDGKVHALDVVSLEVWGCGGERALRDQMHLREWEKGEVARRSVPTATAPPSFGGVFICLSPSLALARLTFLSSLPPALLILDTTVDRHSCAFD